MRRTLHAFAFWILFLQAAGPAFAQGVRTERFQNRDVVAQEIIVRFRDSINADTASQTVRSQDADITSSTPIGRSGAVHLRSRNRNVEELVKEYLKRPDVVYAEPNYVWKASEIPNDTFFNGQWALQNTGQVLTSAGTPGADIKAFQAWDVAEGSRGIVVGMIDTGIDYTHPDLQGNIWSAPSSFTVTINGTSITCASGTHGFNAITRTCDPMDDESHGTHTAGIVGASGNNTVGVSGVSRVASLMGLKFLDNNGSGTTTNAIAAIEFAIQVKKKFPSAANVRVLNASWGGFAFSQAMLDEINLANANDMLFVASAGNSTQNNDASPQYPSSYNAPNVIAVAATDNKDRLADFSNFGAASVHLGAPGAEVLSTLRGDIYTRESGTSMSAAMVSGAAALILSACGLNTSDLKSTILSSVDAVPALLGVTSTGGRLNVNTAIRRCAGDSPGSFTLAVSPSIRTIAFDSGNQFTVSVDPLNGFSSPVTLSAINVPAGMTPSFDTSTLASGSTTLTINFDTGIATGTYFIGIVATGGGVTRNLQIIVTVGLPLSCSVNMVNGFAVTSGILKSTDAASLHRPQSFAKYCTFTLDADRAVTIQLSGGFDTYLYLLSSTGSVLASADNGFSGTDSQVDVQLSPGTYIIEATSAKPGLSYKESTSYTIRLSLTRPTVSSITPEFGTMGTNVDVTITGTVFFGSPFSVKVSLCPGTVVSNIQVINNTTAQATLSLPNNIGSCRVSVINPAGESNNRTFEILPPPPTIATVSPNAAVQGQSTLVTLTGTNFLGTVQVFFNGLQRNTQSVTATAITFNLSLSVNQAPGVYFIKVVNGGGTSNLAPFTVLQAPPQLFPISPSAGGPGLSVNVVLGGNSFGVPLQIDTGPKISVTNLNVVSANRVEATFNIASDAPLGDYPITVTTAAGTSGVQIFKLLPLPSITSFTPSRAFLGMTTTVVLTGANFVCPLIGITIDGIDVFPNWGAGVCSANSITMTLQVLNSAPLGPRTLTVNCSNGTSNPITIDIVKVPPIIQSISPLYGAQGTTVNVTITGSGMSAGVVNLNGSGVQASTISSTASNLTAALTIAANAAIGPRGLTVTNSNGVSDPVTFSVTPPTWPDLTVTQSVPPVLGSGWDETYSITVRNVGTRETTAPFTVVENIWSTDKFVSAGPGWNCSVSGQVVTCTVTQSIAANSERTFQLVVTTFQGSGFHSNVVSVNSTEDFNVSNNTSTVNSQVVGLGVLKLVVSPTSLQPGQQGTLSITLPSMFPHEIVDALDTVTISFTPGVSGAPADPALQFATGGKTVAYSFKANSLSADFPGVIGPVGFQAGTVAGTLTFTLSLRTNTGQVVTSSLNVNVASAAPTLKDLSSAKTASGFETAFNLISSTREVRFLTFQFNTSTPIQLSCGGVTGCSASGSVITFNVTSLFNAWYANNAAYGSLATVRVPFAIQGTLSGTITVTLNNTIGNSNTMSFVIP